MRVLVAGATGVVGRQLVPLLTAVGHDVVGLARSRHRAAAVEQAGARMEFVDALDPAALRRAVREAEPEAVVHLLTAIPGDLDPRRMAAAFELTNRLRTEGTRNLLDAAQEVGVRKVVAQGVAFVYDPEQPGLADEDAPWWRHPPRQFAPVLAALQELERLTAGAGGLVLRYGHLYGPGTAYAADGTFVRRARKRMLPVVGKGTGMFSFTHTHDAATAVVAALDKDVAGALNVVDDDPAPPSVWVPELARTIGAPAPRRVPTWLARLAVGPVGVALMTRLRGADNTRARLSLDWRPAYASWRQGFGSELAAGSARVTG
jgi:nucleoside-diphosphate-sugar epimerase